MLSFRTLRRHTRNNWFLHQALMVVTAVNVPKSKFPLSVRTQINNRILTICNSLESDTTSSSAIDFNNLIKQINIAILGLQLPASDGTIDELIDDEIPLKKIDRFIIAATNKADLLKDGNLKCYELFCGQKFDESDEIHVRHLPEEEINTRGRKKMKCQNSKTVNNLPISASDNNYYRTSSQLLRDLLSDTEEDLVQTSDNIIPKTIVGNSTQTTPAEIQNLLGNDVNDKAANVMDKRRKEPRDFINFKNFNSREWRKFDDDFRSDLDDHILNYNTIVDSYLENSNVITDLSSQMTTSSGYDSLSAAGSDTLSASLSSIDLSDSESLLSQISSNSSTEFEFDYNFDLGISCAIPMDQDTTVFDSDLET